MREEQAGKTILHEAERTGSRVEELREAEKKDIEFYQASVRVLKGR